MNTERTQAYGRVVKTLDDLGPTKLHADEQERVRTAADTLIFAEDPFAGGAPEAMGDIRALADELVQSGRWTEERASELVDDVLGTGPLAPVA